MAEKQQHEASIEYPDPQTGKLVNRKFDMNIAEQRHEMFELLARASHPFAVKSTYSHVQNAGTSIDQTVASSTDIPQPAQEPATSLAPSPAPPANTNVVPTHAQSRWYTPHRWKIMPWNWEANTLKWGAWGTLVMPGLGTAIGAATAKPLQKIFGKEDKSHDEHAAH